MTAAVTRTAAVARPDAGRRRRTPRAPARRSRSSTTPACSWPASSCCSRRWPGCWRSRSVARALAPDFLTEFVLYALSATNLTILVALVFVLARNIVKLVVERRRGAAVRALPRQARGRAARDDDHSGGARADRRQRADSQQRRPLVQRADGRGAVVGQRDCRRLLPGAAAARVGAGPAVGARAGGR